MTPKREGELDNLKFYFSNLCKNKLSQCAATVLLVCCYLYRKRSNTNNVNAEAKEQGEICKLLSMTPVFLPRYREASKLPPSPRWSPLQAPSSRSGNSMDSLGPSPRASRSLTCLPASLSRMLPTVFTIKLLSKSPQALFPSVHGGGYTTNAVGVISQDYKPLRYTTMVRISTE